MSHRPRWRAPAAALVVALGAAAVPVPAALYSSVWSPDSVAHLATAHAWVQGAGWAELWRWNFYLDATVPLPAFAVRAPLVSLLAALPLSLGATVPALSLLHALWAAAVAGALVLVASRFLRLPAAFAVGVLVTWSPGWAQFSVHLWTAVTAVAALLLVLLTAPGVLRSAGGALLCAAATLLAFAARPNLGVLVAAVAGAAAWQLGPRRAARHVPLWLYLAAFAALYAALRLAVTAATGFAPYAGYGVTAEILHAQEGYRFQKEYVGTAAFVRGHWQEILATLSKRPGALFDILFVSGFYNRLGFIALPGVVYALLRRRASLEERLCALAALAFAAVVLANYSAFARRYVVLGALCGALCGCALLDALGRRLERRAAEGGRRRLAALGAWLTPGVALLAVAGSAPGMPLYGLAAWQRYRAEGALGAQVPTGARDLCRFVDEDAIVAAPRPWIYAFWCGNAGLELPPDLSPPAVQQRFFDEQHPGYVISDGRAEYAWLQHSPHVRPLAARHPYTLYEVLGAGPASRPWRAPPPVACAGLGPECSRAWEPDSGADAGLSRGGGAAAPGGRPGRRASGRR